MVPGADRRESAAVERGKCLKGRVYVRFVHLFMNCVPSLKNSFGTSASSCSVSDIFVSLSVLRKKVIGHVDAVWNRKIAQRSGDAVTGSLLKCRQGVV